MKRLMVVVAALLAACGDSPSDPIVDPGGGDPVGGPGTTDVVATGDYAVTAVEAISYRQEDVCPPYASVGSGTSSFGLAALIVELSDATGRCVRAGAGQAKSESGLVRLSVVRRKLGSAPLALRTGSYAWGGVTLEDGTMEEVGLQAHRFGWTCSDDYDDAIYGSVTIDSVDATGVKGSLSFTLQGAGTVSGTFETAPCGVDVFYECTGYKDFPPVTACVN